MAVRRASGRRVEPAGLAARVRPAVRTMGGTLSAAAWARWPTSFAARAAAMRTSRDEGDGE